MVRYFAFGSEVVISMSLFKQYDIFRVLESIESLMLRYFKLRKKLDDHEEAINAMLDEVFPRTVAENEVPRRKIVAYVGSLGFYPESEQMKYFVKSIILIQNKGIKAGSRDDHEINRKLFLTYDALKARYKMDVDDFEVDDIDRLGYWESLRL